jgi:hypothetical protein
MSLAKRKKKRQRQEVVVQQQEEELAGSAYYIANREIDQIIKKGKDRLKHAIAISDEKLTRTKKEIVREIAVEMENKGYPVYQICDRLSKSYKGLVSDRTVRDSLDAKYKNSEQSEVIKMQENHEGGNLYPQQEQVSKKDYKEVTQDDIEFLSPSKAKQVAKYQMSLAQWWEQQAKQNQQEVLSEDKDKDKDKIIADLKKEKEELKKFVDELASAYSDALDPKWTDAEVGQQIRAMVRKAKKEFQKTKKRPDQTKGKV